MTKSNPRTSFVGLSLKERREAEKLCETPGWRIVGQEDLPTFIPEDLRRKIDSGIVISSSTMASDRTYLVCNNLRVDTKTSEIDQEPFVLSVFSSGASTGGMFVHHGDWDGRTEKPPNRFWDIVDESGVGDYFLTNPPTGKTRGTLDELPEGHKSAFYRAVELLQASEGT